MTLAAWLQIKNRTPDDLADQMKVHRSTVYRALNGQCSWKVAKKIEAHTGSSVTAAEIMEQRVA